MTKLLPAICVVLLTAAAGCAPALIGAGAAGGYKVGTDERTVGQIWDDSTITARVKAALIGDKRIKARKIDVDTLEQIVALTGMVGSEAEAEIAVSVARKVAYVKDVKNFLQVGGKSVGQSIDDKVIWSKIRGKLVREKGIRSLNIDVDVNKGVVTLTGAVVTADQKAKVMRIAQTTEGVVKVFDNVLVQRK